MEEVKDKSERLTIQLGHLKLEGLGSHLIDTDHKKYFNVKIVLSGYNEIGETQVTLKFPSIEYGRLREMIEKEKNTAFRLELVPVDL